MAETGVTTEVLGAGQSGGDSYHHLHGHPFFLKRAKNCEFSLARLSFTLMELKTPSTLLHLFFLILILFFLLFLFFNYSGHSVLFCISLRWTA